MQKGSEATSLGKGLLEQETCITIKPAFTGAGGNSDTISAGEAFPDRGNCTQQLEFVQNNSFRCFGGAQGDAGTRIH